MQKLGFSWKINQNLGGRPTEMKELPFLYQNLEILIFKIFAGGQKLQKYEFSDNRRQKLLEQLLKTAPYLTPHAIENSFKRPYGEVEDNIIIYI